MEIIIGRRGDEEMGDKAEKIRRESGQGEIRPSETSEMILDI